MMQKLVMALRPCYSGIFSDTLIFKRFLGDFEQVLSVRCVRLVKLNFNSCERIRSYGGGGSMAWPFVYIG